MPIWSILRPLEIFYGHLVDFVVIWYIFPRFGMLYQEKSGNPGQKVFLCACPTFPRMQQRGCSLQILTSKLCRRRFKQKNGTT
jgi:hypothetical protein